MYKGSNKGKSYGGSGGLINRWYSAALPNELNPSSAQSPNFPFQIKASIVIGNIAKINGIAIASIAKFNGLSIASLSKINGITK